MVEKPEESYVTVELDRKSLDVVQRSFDYLVENYRSINWVAPTSSNIEGAKKISSKLKSFSHDEVSDDVKVPLTYPEWVDYSFFVSYIAGILPKDRIEDRVLLEDLSFDNVDLEDILDQNTPT